VRAGFIGLRNSFAAGVNTFVLALQLPGPWSVFLLALQMTANLDDILSVIRLDSRQLFVAGFDRCSNLDKQTRRLRQMHVPLQAEQVGRAGRKCHGLSRLQANARSST
jgi:hypothetical protein